MVAKKKTKKARKSPICDMPQDLYRVEADGARYVLAGSYASAEAKWCAAIKKQYPHEPLSRFWPPNEIVRIAEADKVIL